jgi:hypothetical protein
VFSYPLWKDWEKDCNLASFLGENILYYWTLLEDCRSFKGARQNWTLYIPSHFTRKENIFPNAILKESKTLDGVTNTSQAWRACSSRYLHRAALQKLESEEEDSSKRPWILPFQHLVNIPDNFTDLQKRCEKLKPIPTPNLIKYGCVETFQFEDFVIISFNHLKTKRRLLYLKTQSVPRCKHF